MRGSSRDEGGPSGGVTVRPAGPDDYASARAVQWSAGWKEAPDKHRYWPSPDQEWVNRHYYREFIAEVDGIVAARIGLEAFCPPFAELVNLCVRPEYQRHGLGRHLTLAGQREAARMGFTALFLQTEIDNLGAHKLYAAQGWVPTAHGKMLRMIKLLDYPLLAGFKRSHPLSQYRCAPVEGSVRKWLMEWYAYVTEDSLKLLLEGGASQSDSDGVGPSISGFEWNVEQGRRGLKAGISKEPIKDLEPGHYVEMEITAANTGKAQESGAFQMVLPQNVRVSNPETNTGLTFKWNLDPGETLRQPLVVQIEPGFDASALWELNYASVPISTEVFWAGQRALISCGIPMATPRG